jgi:hypothetical protein
MSEGLVNTGIIIAYVLLGLAALAVIAFAVFQLVTNFKSARYGLIGLGVLIVIVLISYSLSTSEAYEDAGPAVSQWVGGGIIATYILVAIAFLSAVYTEVSKYFR